MCGADGQCTPLYVAHQYNTATFNMLRILQEVHSLEPNSSFPMMGTCVIYIYMQQGASYHHGHTTVAQPQWYCH